MNKISKLEYVLASVILLVIVVMGVQSFKDDKVTNSQWVNINKDILMTELENGDRCYTLQYGISLSCVPK